MSIIIIMSIRMMRTPVCPVQQVPVQLFWLRKALRLLWRGSRCEMLLTVLGSTPTVEPLHSSPRTTHLRERRNSSFFHVYRKGLDTKTVQKRSQEKVQSGAGTWVNMAAARVQQTGCVVSRNTKHTASTQSPSRRSLRGKVQGRLLTSWKFRTLTRFTLLCTRRKILK